jgi:hypothetical protein
LIWLIWLSRFCPHEGKKRVKGIETSMVLSVFVPYCRKKKMPSDTPSLFIENI